MFRYVDKNTQLIVESPIRFDLRIKENRHLKLFKPTGERSPKPLKKGFTMRDIALDWGMSFHTLRRKRSVLLPQPDGVWNTCLVWKKIPTSPFLKGAGFTVKDIASHYGKHPLYIRKLVKLKKFPGPDGFKKLTMNSRPSAIWLKIPEYKFNRKPINLLTLEDIQK